MFRIIHLIPGNDKFVGKIIKLEKKWMPKKTVSAILRFNLSKQLEYFCFCIYNFALEIAIAVTV